MKKEDLLAMGLTEEQADKVMDGLNGDFVTKSRFNEVNTELKAARTALSERDKQLEELKKVDAAALQAQITQLQADNKQKDADYAAQLKALKISNAVELALTGAKAKNNTAAKALLADFISKAELTDDGTVKAGYLEGKAIGEDEVKKLAENEETAFLFEKAAAGGFKGAKPAEKGDPPGINGMTLERLRGMNATERHTYSLNHPEEYRALYNGGVT